MAPELRECCLVATGRIRIQDSLVMGDQRGTDGKTQGAKSIGVGVDFMRRMFAHCLMLLAMHIFPYFALPILDWLFLGGGCRNARIP